MKQFQAIHLTHYLEYVILDPNTYWSDLEKWIDIKSGVYFGASSEKTSDAIYYYM